MRLGIDFDNTIVCYDAVFYDEALKRRLVPADLARTKTAVRDYLRQNGQEPAWTELQGFVYGPGISLATPFPGVHHCLREIQQRGIAVCVISHKTRFPVLGPTCNLHDAARQWLADVQLLDESTVGRSSVGADAALQPDQIFFEETKQAKLQRIADNGCTHFVDDLPEFLAEPGFPPGVRRILFDPHQRGGATTNVESAHRWDDIAGMIR